MKKLFIDLQLFADDPADTTATEPATEGQGTTEPTTEPAEEKKYSEKEVDKIIQQRKAEWQKQQKKAVEEAEKLAQMNEQQKAQYENEQLKKEKAELESQLAKIELAKSASAILKESNIDATEDVLAIVVGENADQTKANIDAFVKVVEAQVKKAELARATGTTPQYISNNGNQLSEIQKRKAKYL